MVHRNVSNMNWKKYLLKQIVYRLYYKKNFIHFWFEFLFRLCRASTTKLLVALIVLVNNFLQALRIFFIKISSFEHWTNRSDPEKENQKKSQHLGANELPAPLIDQWVGYLFFIFITGDTALIIFFKHLSSWSTYDTT